MARRSNILAGAVLLAGLAALNSVSFVNPQPVERSSRMAMKGSAVEWVPKLSRDVVEVMFTAPAQGARSRMLIRADADVSGDQAGQEEAGIRPGLDARLRLQALQC